MQCARLKSQVPVAAPWKRPTLMFVSIVGVIQLPLFAHIYSPDLKKDYHSIWDYFVEQKAGNKTKRQIFVKQMNHLTLARTVKRVTGEICQSIRG